MLSLKKTFCKICLRSAGEAYQMKSEFSSRVKLDASTTALFSAFVVGYLSPWDEHEVRQDPETSDAEAERAGQERKQLPDPFKAIIVYRQIQESQEYHSRYPN